MLTFPLTCVHVFQFEDRHFLFDGQSMLLAKISSVLAEAVDLAIHESEQEFYTLLDSRFGEETKQRVLTELRRMKSTGFFECADQEKLFAKDQANRKERQNAAQVVVLQLLVTGICNLRCTYCYADQGTFQSTTKSRFMMPDVARKALQFLTDSQDHFLINLLGGEPFLHPQMGEILQIIRQHGLEHGQIPQVDITTNGTIFPASLVPQLRVMGATSGSA